jgi:hypothetical protein
MAHSRQFRHTPLCVAPFSARVLTALQVIHLAKLCLLNCTRNAQAWDQSDGAHAHYNVLHAGELRTPLVAVIHNGLAQALWPLLPTSSAPDTNQLGTGQQEGPGACQAGARLGPFTCRMRGAHLLLPCLPC